MNRADPGGWTRVALECPGEDAGAVEEALAAAGAIAVSLEDAGEDPRFESWPPDRPIWGRTRVSGLFPAGVDGVGRMTGHVSPEVLETARVSGLPDADWTRAARERIAPMRFGERLWVSPTWAEPPPEAASGVVVRLDPGLAFGTGSHPSTGLCLRRIEGLDLAAKLVIDFGCGSGILGIAALRLGAGRCLAVDIDPRAREAARGNALRNRVAEHFDIMSPPAVAGALRRSGTSASDLLVANVLAGPLAALAGTFGDLVAHGGELMLSGILAGQDGALIEAYAPWFGLEVAAREDEWVLLAGPRTRRAP